MNSPLSGSFSSLFANYRPPPGVFDEAIQGGELRAPWQAFVQQMDRVGTADLQRRWEQAQRQMLNDGVTFRPQDVSGNASRPWILDGVPLLLTEKEWQPIAEAMVQRAKLYEIILADLFGSQQLLRDRLLPPECLFGHPAYCPAYHGLVDAEQSYLQLFATDLSRGTDGKWWVNGDRTRAPFGLGYLLENRIVTSRNLPAPFRHCRVKRLAPFFIALQDTLREMAPRYRDNPRIVLWTKGPTSPAYFEDAYLARYLGYTLAEGDDLAVRENRVMLKTLGDCCRSKCSFVVKMMMIAILSNLLLSRCMESQVWLKSFVLETLRLQMPSVVDWWSHRSFYLSCKRSVVSD